MSFSALDEYNINEPHYIIIDTTYTSYYDSLLSKLDYKWHGNIYHQSDIYIKSISSYQLEFSAFVNELQLEIYKILKEFKLTKLQYNKDDILDVLLNIKQSEKYIKDIEYELDNHNSIESNYTIIQQNFDKIHFDYQENLSNKIYSILQHFTINDIHLYYNNYIKKFNY
jgi:hypothetical protein